MQELDDILRAATADVDESYYRLPIDGGPAVYRERVYCYELYHQMRRRWPQGAAYLLSGEVAKRGHPILRRLGVDVAIRAKMDAGRFAALVGKRWWTVAVAAAAVLSICSATHYACSHILNSFVT